VIVRVIVPPFDIAKAAAAIRDALKDPEVDSVILHKPSSRVRLPDGREIVFDSQGRQVAVCG
jgi:hypothetical protein